MDEIHTPKGKVPVVSTYLHFKDILGAWKVRWGIGRMNYKINPGLYAVGKPDNTSPVLVSANYKLTFDVLRQELSGLDCWILILDTKGINVWCAAGKGTFGTDELVNRISKTGLPEIVSHRKLVLPQLGATGVSAHEVKKQTGFSVVYGPVRAKDIKAFFDSGFKATEEMRTVKFTMRDRLVLTPVELVTAAKSSLMVFGVIFLLNLFVTRPFGLADFIAYVGAVLTGTVLTPLLLPVIPGRAFAWKGWLMGLLWTLLIVWYSGCFVPECLFLAIGYLLVLPSLSAYLAMNFTGSSTYTSFSGVIKEMKIAVPLIAISSIVGIVLLLINSIWA
ncbi:MAG TPA: acetyl-CoA synthase subunit gamma [Clostridiaceae bacterium]|nr:acetyl-CoA synthase subunit gamma [Clostridiaceae bacterium]